MVVLKDALENFLKKWGVYEFIHSPYYFMKTAFIRLLRPQTTLSFHSATATFWTPTPILYTRVRELRGEDKLLEELIARAQPGDIFWDIGANIGIYSLLLSSAVGKQGKVYAFEPEPQTYDWLCENKTLNQAVNLETMPIALGASEGEVTLYPAKRAGMGIHKLFDDGKVQSDGIPVSILTGDQLIARGRAQ